MDSVWLQEITKKYLDTIANASEFNFVDEDARIPLTDVYIMLEAIKTKPPKSKEKRDELSSYEERRESAGLNRPDTTTAQEIKQPLVPLSKVLAENSHVVLLGEPGAGKTTALNFIGLCFAKEDERWAEEQLDLHELRIPIKLQLQVYGSDLANEGAQMIPALARQTASRLQTIKKEKSEELVASWLETDCLLILLDGLDEIHEKRGEVIDSIRHFAESPDGKKARIVITSRLAGYTTLGGPFKEFTLTPLQRRDDAKNFLRGWLTSLKPEWKDEINQKVEDLSNGLQAQPALRRMMNNPLILRMAAEQFAYKGNIAQSRAELYENYVQEAWLRANKRGAQDADKNSAIATLEALAWEIQMGSARNEKDAIRILLDQKHNLANDELMAQELLTLVHEKMGLVVLINQKFVFSHATFQEYFVAKRLHTAWQNDSKLTWKFLRPRLHVPEWREPLFLLVSALDHIQCRKLIDQIRLAKSNYENILWRDFLLAAELIGTLNSPHPDSIAPFIKIFIEDITKFPFEQIIPGFIDIFRDTFHGPLHSIRIRSDAILARWETKTGVVEWALIHIGKSAVPELLNIAQLYRRPSLLSELMGKNLLRSTINVLSEIGDPQIIPTLFHALKNENIDIRSAATKALGKIGDPEGIPGLLQALEDGDTYVRHEAVDALSQIRDPQAISALIQALKNEDQFVREVAAIKLDEIQSSKDKNQYVYNDSAEELVQLDNLQDVPSLIQELIDTNEYVRQNAVHALYRISDPRVIPALFQTIKDQDHFVRGHAAKALGLLGGRLAIPVLLQALKDDEYFVRGRAAAALGEIGDPQATSALLEALKDDEYFVRGRAAGALGQIGDPQSIPGLLQALWDEDSVYGSAAYALGKIVRRWQIANTDPEQAVQIQILRQTAKTTSHIPDFIDFGVVLLERLETLTAPQFDPLNPPPPPKWQGALKYAGYTFALMILLSLVTVITIALTSAQGTLKGFVEDWVQSQPLSIIIALFLTLPLLATVIGITINTLKKRLEK
jgi:HEAT repeat protein